LDRVIEVHPVEAPLAAVLALIHAEAFDAPWTAEEIVVLMTGLGAFAFIAQIGETPAGFILCRTIVDEAEVLTLATRPQARRQGVASALLAAVRTAALAGGAATLFLEVAADNPAAQALYEAQGFRQVGRRPAYYSRTQGLIPGLIMRLDLNR
jgi:ribosomal-protein-alanine N-acetyltransferase